MGRDVRRPADEHGDVVLAAAVQGELQQLATHLLARRGAAQRLGDLVVRDMPRESVAAEQRGAAALDLHRRDDGDGLIGAQRTRSTWL
jgi:hypothetical protein